MRVILDFRFAYPGWYLIHSTAAERTKFCSSHNRPAPEAVTSARADVRHSVRADSRGMLWYSFWAATSKIGRFDTRTKQFTEFANGARRWNGYGITVDRQDRVWAVGMSTPAGDPPLVHMYNQETGQWKAYQTSGSTRRQGVDSKGKVWASQYFGNAISKIDRGCPVRC